MNLKKGSFRLTLVLSILVGVVSSFWLLEYTIEYDASHMLIADVGGYLEYKRSHEAGIIMQCLPYGLQIRINNEEMSRTTERMVKKVYPHDFELLRRLHSETHEPFGPDYILYWWRHLAVLSLPGFVTVWLVFGLARWVVIPFIIKGFQCGSEKGVKLHNP